MSAPTPTIPKQTQISLNYWNSTTSVDGCEFETVFQEPVLINAGDSINVRNSSLDTSLLSVDNIIIDEDIYLVFEWITYAMMKKATMDFQNASTDGTFHDAWIYGKNRSATFDAMSQIAGGGNPQIIPVADVVQGTSYQVQATGSADTTPPFFTWNMINSALTLTDTDHMTLANGQQYQVIGVNNTNTLINTTVGANNIYGEVVVMPNIFAPVDVLPIPQTYTINQQNFFDGTMWVGVYSVPFAYPTVINTETANLLLYGGLFGNNWAITVSNVAGIPTATGVLLGQVGMELLKGYDTVYTLVEGRGLFHTPNYFWFVSYRASGDFNDDTVINMSPYVPAGTPTGSNLWAQPIPLCFFNNNPFIATSVCPPDLNTSATVSLAGMNQYDNFVNYKMGVFHNPLYEYVFQSLGASRVISTDLSGNRFFDANPNTLTPDYEKLSLFAGGWNTGSTYPNATGMNTPIILVDGKTLDPIRRSTSILLPAGSYSKAEIAVEITRLLADLQTPNSSVNYSNPLTAQNPPPIYQTNQVSLINGGSPPELQSSAFTNEYTYQTFTESASNPFQVEIVIGIDTADDLSAPWNSLTDMMPSFNFPNLSFTAPATAPAVKTIPLPMRLNGLVNNITYFDAIGNRFQSLPCCFVPLCDDFVVQGNNVNLFRQDPDVNGSVEGGAFSWWNSEGATQGFMNCFDTKVPELFSSYKEESTSNAYQTGVTFTSDTTILPCVMNLDAYWNYTGGVYGTNEFSLLYDPTKNIYSFNFLHSPILTNSGNTEPVPTVVRSRTTANNPYSAFEPPPQFNGGWDKGLQTNEKRTDVNDRHSGIILTNITSHFKSPQGANASFWEKLGFNIADICIPSKYVGRGIKIPYSIFSKYTTGELYTISQNVNVLNVNSARNNEQMVIPDTFSMWLNPQPQVIPPPVPPAPTPPPVPPPAGFNRDVLYASSADSYLLATKQPASVLNDLGGNILIEITGYGTGSELQDVDAFAVKSIVSLYYLTGNTFLSSTGDSFTYYHQSTIPQRISKLKVRILNPITKRKLTNLLGDNNSVYITITQNQQITMEGAEPATPPPKTKHADKGTEDSGD
jgi:hypothetical protein